MASEEKARLLLSEAEDQEDDRTSSDSGSSEDLKENDEESNLVAKDALQLDDDKPYPTEFTDIVGGKGRWQIRILFLSILIGIPSSWNHLGMSFLGYPVDHWCARPNDSNLSLTTWFVDYLPNTTIKGKEQHSQCEMLTKKGKSIGKVPCESWEYSREFNSVINHWNLVCDKEWMVSASQSLYMIGFLFAVLISGQISDIYGRHPAIMMNIVILVIAGLAAAYANSFILFTIFRIFVAVGQAGKDLVLFVLYIECLGAKYRAKYAILHGCGWYIGYSSLPLIAWLVPDWFYLQLIITLPSIFFLTYFWLLPESPRWLLSTGKLDKSIRVLKTVAKANRVKIKDMEEEAKKLLQMQKKEKGESSAVTILDLLRTPYLRTKTLCLYFCWVAIAFTYYGLSLNTNDLEGNVYIVFFICGLVEIPAMFFCLLTLDRFGRKKPFIFTLLVGGLSCLSCIFVPEGYPQVKTVLALSGKMFVSASFSIVYIYSAEIFPTVARNVGVGSSSTMARVGSCLAPFMKELGKVTNPSVPLALFGSLSLISALLVLKLPETNLHPVPETLIQAENFGK